jgi:hypothetical protein
MYDPIHNVATKMSVTQLTAAYTRFLEEVEKRQAFFGNAYRWDTGFALPLQESRSLIYQQAIARTGDLGSVWGIAGVDVSATYVLSRKGGLCHVFIEYTFMPKQAPRLVQHAYTAAALVRLAVFSVWAAVVNEVNDLAERVRSHFATKSEEDIPAESITIEVKPPSTPEERKAYVDDLRKEAKPPLAEIVGAEAKEKETSMGGEPDFVEGCPCPLCVSRITPA